MPELMTFAIPGGRVTWNSLHDTNEIRYLTQDLLLIELSGGDFIDVSWYPEHDPMGSYHVVRYRDDWDNQVDSAETRLTSDIVEIVRRMATS